MIEPYVSSRAGALTDLYCVEGLRRAAGSLQRAWENGADREARAGMSWASLLGGMALANAGLGVVHAFAAPVGGRWNAPHGAICAAVLPHAMEINIEALRRRAPASSALRRYDEIARIVTRQPHAIADDGVRMDRRSLRSARNSSPLAPMASPLEISMTSPRKAAQTSSMKGNPIALSHEELREIAIRAL